MHQSTRYTSLFAAAMGFIASLCVTGLELAYSLMSRQVEYQPTAMARFKATLAQWHATMQEARSAMRADMRAQGHGAVFNSMPVPTGSFSERF